VLSAWSYILAEGTNVENRDSWKNGSLRLAEIGVRHAPQPSADDEVAAVRRHRMLHDL
jgi:hypothetical protein